MDLCWLCRYCARWPIQLQSIYTDLPIGSWIGCYPNKTNSWHTTHDIQKTKHKKHQSNGRNMSERRSNHQSLAFCISNDLKLVWFSENVHENNNWKYRRKITHLFWNSSHTEHSTLQLPMRIGIKFFDVI